MPLNGPGKPEEGRDAIAAAACDVFYEHGFQKASVREIARRAGLTQAALYYHFVNKEDVLFTILERFSDELLLSLMASLSRDKSPRDRLEDMIVTQVSWMKDRRKEIKILVEDKRNLGADRFRAIRKKEKAIFEVYRSCLKELKSTGKLRALDVTAATFGVLGMVNWLYHWYRDNGQLSLDELGRGIVDIFFHGVLREEPAGG